MSAVSRETSRRRRPGAIAMFAGLLLLAVAAVGCRGVKGPNGWGGVTFDESGDTLYANLDGDTLVALSADDVREQWHFPDDARGDEKDIDLEGVYGEVAATADRVIVGGYDGSVYALNAENGAILWLAEADGPVVGGPVIAGDLVIVGSDDEQVRALDLETGSVRWSRELGGRIWAAAVVEDDVVYIGTLEGELYALGLADGSPVWDEPYGADAGFPAAVTVASDGAVVLAGSFDKRMHAIDAATGQRIWATEGGNWFDTRPVVDGDLVFAGNLDGKLYAMRLESGEIAWEYEAEGPIRASVIVSGDTVVVTDKNGFAHGVGRDNGQRAWISSDLGTTLLANLAIRSGLVYVRGENGALWSVDPANGALVQLRGAS